MDAKVDVTNTEGRMLADATQRSLKTETRVFDQASQQADGEVKRIIAANLGRAVKANLVPTAGADPEAVASAPRMAAPARSARRPRHRSWRAHADPLPALLSMATSSASARQPRGAAASRLSAAEAAASSCSARSRCRWRRS